MNASDNTPWPNLLTWRCILLVAMLDALAWGLLWVAAPGKLFEYLDMAPRNDSWAGQFFTPRDDPPKGIQPPRDAPGLLQLLAIIWLAHAVFLALVVWRPRSLGQLVVVPLIGHALGAVLWVWALATTYTLPANRMPFPNRGALVWLTLHDAVWLPLLIAFLILRRPRADRGSHKEIIAVQ